MLNLDLNYVKALSSDSDNLTSLVSEEITESNTNLNSPDSNINIF